MHEQASIDQLAAGLADRVAPLVADEVLKWFINYEDRLVDAIVYELIKRGVVPEPESLGAEISSTRGRGRGQRRAR